MTQPLIDVCVGAVVMLAGIVSGCVIHMRWLDRRLYKPYPKKPKVQA